MQGRVDLPKRAAGATVQVSEPDQKEPMNIPPAFSAPPRVRTAVAFWLVAAAGAISFTVPRSVSAQTEVPAGDGIVNGRLVAPGVLRYRLSGVMNGQT